MDNLNTETLLIISPHFESFIRNQAEHFRSEFKELAVLVPIPYLLSSASKVPVIRTHFEFMRDGSNLRNKSLQDYRIMPSRFLTLPIEVFRKRNCYLASKSCIKTISKNNVNFDLIHAHFLDCGFIGAKLKSLYNKPLVVTAHGGEVYNLPHKNGWHKALAKYALTEADQVITVSQFMAENVLSLGVPPDKIHVIPNGYNEKLFRPCSSTDARKQLGLPLDKKILLSVGGLVAVKGQTYLLDALKLVLKKHDNVILMIIGLGPLKENLLKKTRELKLEKNVFFAGWKEHNEIPMWMNACDVFVLPSLIESFGVVVIESMACAKPVVATNVGGVPEIIRNDNVGILVEPANPKSLSDGILEALDKKWVPETILNYAKEYSWIRIAERTLKIYREVLGTR